MTRLARAPLAGVAAVAALVGCANTIDPTASPDGERPTTTTVFVPAGSAAQLIDQLLDEAGSLSESIVQGEGQQSALARVEALWSAARPDLEATVSPRILDELDEAVEMLRRGVERRRPADADKATINLRSLVHAAGI